MPAAQGFAVATDVPAGQKEPAGQGNCARPPEKDGHQKPAVHGFDVAVMLAAARQKPAEHAPHEERFVKDEPPDEKEPTGHALVALIAAPMPAGQK